MDRHSEVEIKFRADKVTNEVYHRFVTDRVLTGCKVAGYIAVRGTDTFWKVGKSVLRYRTDGGPGCLTYKARKSAESLVDRVEVDLPFSDEVQPRDVRKVMEMIEAEELFSIEKMSFIYHTKGKVDGKAYVATLALYDVEVPDRPVQRFLEVEIERNNKIDPSRAKLALQEWERIIQKELDVGEPINRSLFEIYASVFGCGGSSSK